MIFSIFDRPDITAAGFIDYLDKMVQVKNMLQEQLASQLKQSEDSLNKLQANAARRKDIRASVLGVPVQKPVAAAAAVPAEMKPTGFVTEGAAGGYDAHTPAGKRVAAGAATPAAAASSLKEVKKVGAAILSDLYTASRDLQAWCQIYGTPAVIERCANIREYAAKILVAEKVDVPKLAIAAQKFSGDRSVARRAITTIKARVAEMDGLGKLNDETQRNANRLLESAISVEFNLSRMQ